MPVVEGKVFGLRRVLLHPEAAQRVVDVNAPLARALIVHGDDVVRAARTGNGIFETVCPQCGRHNGRNAARIGDDAVRRVQVHDTVDDRGGLVAALFDAVPEARRNLIVARLRAVDLVDHVLFEKENVCRITHAAGEVAV